MGYISKKLYKKKYIVRFPYIYKMNNFFRVLLPLLVALCLFPKQVLAQNAPVLTASGNQVYCPGSSMEIATDFNISDTGNTSAEAVYIQISSGYVNGQDLLSLGVTIPNVATSWNATSGKLTISGIGGQELPYSTLIYAVENVVYTNSDPNPSGTRTFSITLGEANYLPSTQHYYRFVSSVGITWTAARAAAENSTYYGLQGYLATLLADDEAQLCGEQATGTGWIGGSDAAAEGIWKWVTGPEAGTTFWSGGVNGSSPNFEYWNTGEPNNAGDEDYAHITAPGVGIPGSWNDLPNGGSGGPYVPMGYIIEYGGMPGDPILQISASTSISIPTIVNTTPGSACGSGSVVLQAAVNNGVAKWYAQPTGGTPLATGSSFTTPVLSETTTYYASVFESTCNAARIPVTATINPLPEVTAVTPVTICSGNTATLQAEASVGTVRWYNEPTGGTPIGTGNTFTQAVTSDTTFYAEALNNGCTSATRHPVSVTLFELPVVNDEEVYICEGGHAVLNAQIANVTYHWSTGEDGDSIVVATPGSYTVEVTNAAGCSAIKTFSVLQHERPVIDGIGVGTGATIMIIMENRDTADFEYSIDGVNYQASNTFSNLSAGTGTAYVRDVNGCGTDTDTYKIYLVPKFFSPNNDSYNELFTIAGLSAYPEADLTIFDRYGKIITNLNQHHRTWDGTYNGTLLPAADYWYVLKLDKQSAEIRGHFSLLR